MEKHREGILGSNRNEEYLITVRPQDRREGPSHVRVDYQLPGHGKRPSTAWVDLNIVPDPEVWLTERLGPLVNFALGPANQEAVVVPSLLEIPGGYGEGLDLALLFARLVRPADPMEGFRVRRPEVESGRGFALATCYPEAAAPSGSPQHA
jgi:hypothetical protein